MSESTPRLAYPGIALVGAYVRARDVRYRASAPTSVDVEHVRCPECVARHCWRYSYCYERNGEPTGQVVSQHFRRVDAANRYAGQAAQRFGLVWDTEMFPGGLNTDEAIP